MGRIPGRARPSVLYTSTARSAVARAVARAFRGSAAAWPLLAVAPALHAQAPAPAQARGYDIAAGTLEDVLTRFGRESAILLSFTPELTAGLRSPGLHGRYTVRTGFDTLLTGSGVAAAQQPDGSYVLRRAPTPPAAAAAPAAPGATTLAPVVVTADALRESATGPVVGYVAARSAAGTKTDTPLLRTPQAVSVVTRDQMDAQNVQSVAQALRYTSGVNAEQRGTNTDALEYIYARGFQIDQLWNGLRTPGAAGGQGYNVTSFDPYLFERIELLHGPASVLYGQGSPGGVLNLVSKRPTAEPLHEIGLQTGNHGRAQAFFDLGGPLNEDGTLLYRLTGDGISTGTQTEHVREQRYAIAPSITWRPNTDTHVTVFANYQNDPKAGLYNSVPAVGTVLPGKVAIPRGLDTGEPGFDSFHKRQGSLGYELEHRLDSVWTLRQNYRFLHNSQTIQYVSNNGFAADGVNLLRTPYLNTGTVDSHTLDNQAVARFTTGAVSHTAIVGLDYQDIQFDHYFYGSAGTATDAPPLDVRNPVHGRTIAAPTFMFATSNAQSLKQLGVYAQDQVDIGRWSFLLGGRQDRTQEQVTSFKTGATTRQSDHAFTWRAGGVYQFDNGIAPYASYARSFQPLVGTDFSGSAFRPQTGAQYEAGVKFQPKGQQSFATVAVYHLEQNNVTTSDPAHNGFSIQTGQVRSQGVEAEVHARVDNHLQLIGSYTYTDLLNTRSNTASLGKVPVGIPRDTASLWVDWRAPAGPLVGLQAGLGVRFLGGSYGDVANTFRTDSATLADLMLRYDLGKAFTGMQGWTGTLNVSNLFDRSYVASCAGSSFCTWGIGRVVTAGMRYQW
ncbi:MAG: TonB-dependent siderophore receptor [Pseudomonadota bacterium]